MKPIEEIREAFQRVHRVATGQSREAYMRIPADPRHDADLIVMDAISELERLREAAAAVAHQLEQGEASDGDPESEQQRDVRWCARTLREALGPPAREST